MEVVAGCCFWVNIKPEHVFVVVSDPAKNPTEVLCVNFTGYRADRMPSVMNDPACIIVAGEHPFVTKSTCMCYGCAHTPSVEHLAIRVQNKQARFIEAASPDLLVRIREGTTISEYILPIHGDMIVEQRLV